MVKEGHEIGNHGFTHDYRQVKLQDELNRTNQAVFSATQTYTSLYRPPGGSISTNQLEVVKKSGHLVVLWSLDSKDWLNPGSNRIIRNVTGSAFPGAVVLLHDGGDKRGQTVNALTEIIKVLRSQGYTFVTLSQLLAVEPQTNKTLKK